MPTLFLHMPLAARVAEAIGLGRGLLPAFLWGSVAPDVAQRHGLARSVTHFWTSDDDVSGALKMLRAHPQLESRALEPDERAFVAGYLAHLVTDEQWTFCIWRPYFGRFSPYGGSAEGATLQNAYRTMVDAREREGPPGLARLAAVLEEGDRLRLRPGLLPFVDDALLIEERVIAVDHAYHGPRQEPPDPNTQSRAMGYVRSESFDEFRRRAIEESVALVRDYLACRALSQPLGTEAPLEPGATSAT